MIYQWLGAEGSGRPLVDRRHGEHKVPTSTPRITRASLDTFVAGWQPRGTGRRGAVGAPRSTPHRAEENQEGLSSSAGGPLDGTTGVHELVVRLASADADFDTAESEHEKEMAALLDRLEKLEIANVQAKYESERLTSKLRRRDARVDRLQDRRTVLETTIRERLGPQGTQDLSPR
jgi:hypothetical protein